MKEPLKIKYVKIKDILPNPYQVRRYFERQSLQSLSESIKAHGVISPVLLRKSKEGYELICGQRRVRAALIASLSEIPAIIIKANDLQCAYLSMIENTQRKDLDFNEEAEGYFNLISYHKVKKEKLCDIMNKDTLYISDKIRLLGLSEKVRFKMKEYSLPERFGLELLKLHDEKKQLEIIEKTKEEELNFKNLSALVSKENRKIISGDEEKHDIAPINKKRMPIFINTVEKSIDLLEKSGADIKTDEKNTDNYIEYTIRIYK